MAELNRRPDRPDPSDGGDRPGRTGDRPRATGSGRAPKGATLKDLFDAAEHPDFAPPEERARRNREGPRDNAARTGTGGESPESEINGLHDRAAADRAELRNRESPAGDRPKEPADRGDRDRDGPKNPDDPGPDVPDSPGELAALRKELAEAKATIADQQTQIKEKDAAIGRLENTCSYLDQKRQDAEAKADEQSAKIDTLTGTVDELTGKVDQLGTMLGDALKQMKSPEQVKPDAPDAVVSDRAVGRALDGVEQRTSASEARDDRLSREPKRGRGELYAAAGGAVTSVGSFAGAGVSFLGGIPDVTAVGAVGGVIGLAAGAGSAVLAAVAFAKKWRRGRNEN